MIVNPPGLPIALAPGASLPVDVAFAPQNGGSRTATLSAQVRNEANTTDAALSGIGVGPKVAVNPNPLVIGGLPFGQPVPPLNATVGNAGGSNLSITGLSITGPDAARFSISNAPNFPVTEGPNMFVPFSLNFTPTAPGKATATLVVTSNDPNTPSLMVPIIGYSGDPKISLDIGTIIFGNQRVGIAAAPQDVTITNTGNSDLHVTMLAITGMNATSFTITAMPKLPATLPVGASAKFSVVFKPVAAGLQMGAVQISSDDPKTPQKILNMTGNGTTPLAMVAPAMLDFGKVRVGQSANQSITISNNGTGPVNVTSLSITGPGKALFVASLGAPFVVSPKSSTVVQVTYKPVAVSTAMAQLTLTTDDPNLTMFQVPLMGTAVSPMFAIAPMMLEFGGLPVGSTSAPQSFTIQNTGNAVLTINTFIVSGPGQSAYTVTPMPKTPAMLPAGGMLTFMVVYKPTGPSPDDAQVIIATDDPNNMSGQVMLHGFGQQADISVTPMDMDTLDFGTVAIGAMKALPVKIQNTGDAPLVIAGLKIMGSNTFSVDPPAPITIAPLKTQTLMVTFTPKVTMTQMATLEIDPMDQNLMPVTLNLLGQGSSPMITAAPPTLDFGPITVMSTSQPQTITITNGAIKGQVIDHVTSDDGHFAVDTTKLTKMIAAGGTTTVDVTFTPDAENTFVGHVRVFMAGATMPAASVTVMGMGTAPSMMTANNRGGCAVGGRSSTGMGALLGVFGLLGLALSIRRRRGR